jgi:Cu2+-exporting ATPase
MNQPEHRSPDRPEPGDATKPCTHCGLPVAVSEDPPEEVFCCVGCQSVYHAIQDAGLDSFYELQDRGGEAARADADVSHLDELDSEAFQRRHTTLRDDGRREADFHLEGVHCAGCVWIVEQMPDFVDGVDVARLNLGRARLHVVWDPESTALSEIGEWLAQFGYAAHPARSDGDSRNEAGRDLLRRMGVTWAIAANVMLLAFALYSGLGPDAEAGLFHAFRYLSFGLATMSIIYGGSLFFRRAWASIRPLLADPSSFQPSRLSIDIPISLGIIGGYTQSTVATVTGAGEIWFDSITVLIAALLTARWLQIRGRRIAGDAADRLLSVIPTTARHVAPSGRTVSVPTDALEPGSVVEVRTGEVIPADGRILEGHSAVHRGVLTGESRPESVQAGDRVHAGAKNSGDTLRVEVTAAGDASRIGQLLNWIDERDAQKAPVVELADRIAGIFVLVILLGAALTWGGWALSGSPEAVRHAVALLVVSCPCALGMATPLAMTMGVGQAARRGIYIKHEGALQQLEQLDDVILDKTGTVTEGDMEIVSLTGDLEAVQAAAFLETASAHPIAQAFERWLVGDAPDGVEPASRPPMTSVEEVAGCGISGVVDERHISVGRPEWLADTAGSPPQRFRRAIDAGLRDAQTPVGIVVDGDWRAVCTVGDPIRSESTLLVERLQDAGVEVTLLSGDHTDVVTSVAAEIGISEANAFGDVSPEDKRAFVRDRVEAEAEGRRVAMIGDGVNDAAALKAASVGIAVDGSANASMVAADVFTTRGGLRPLIDLMEGSAGVMHVVRRNIGMSIAYNVVGISAAAAGFVTPLVAAVAMPLSSLAVVISSIIQNSFEEAPQPTASQPGRVEPRAARNSA